MKLYCSNPVYLDDEAESMCVCNSHHSLHSQVNLTYTRPPLGLLLIPMHGRKHRRRHSRSFPVTVHHTKVLRRNW